MHNIERKNLQAFPFHLVDASPWPILTSLSFGSSSNYHDSLKDIDRREFNLLISLLIPTLILGILPPMINISYFSLSIL